MHILRNNLLKLNTTYLIPFRQFSMTHDQIYIFMVTADFNKLPPSTGIRASSFDKISIHESRTLDLLVSRLSLSLLNAHHQPWTLSRLDSKGSTDKDFLK